jgi:hypothetical protein
MQFISARRGMQRAIEAKENMVKPHGKLVLVS